MPGDRALDTPPVVSVVVTTASGCAGLDRCLASLARQTVPRGSFEVVVVVAGPDAGASERVRSRAAAHDDLRLRVLIVPSPATSPARSWGLATVAGRHVTFVDHRDWVSPGYLAALLRRAEPGVIPVAQQATVTERPGGAVATVSLDDTLVPVAGGTVPVRGHVAVLHRLQGTLIPAAVARDAGFDETLRSGEELPFWLDVLAAQPFELGVCGLREDAVYHRGRASGPADGADVAMETLDVLERLAARPADDHGLRESMLLAGTDRLARCLAAHPQDLAATVAQVESRGLSGLVPRRRLQAHVARDLAILYAFAPYVDTSAMVAVRRLRARGAVVDVVSNSLAGLRETDPGGFAVADDVVGRHTEVQSSPTWFYWPDLQSFCEQGLRQVEEWVEEKGPYHSVYSRVMLAGSHLLAALVKLRWPETRWVAEFSDPMLWDSDGKRRPTLARPGPLLEELVGALQDRGVEVPDPLPVAQLVELLAYALADEVLFTNENQRAFMLGYLQDRDLAREVARKARSEHHPTLPAALYDRARSTVVPVAGRVNIGFFGVFYTTRGLSEVIEALGELTSRERGAVVLHVFTADAVALSEQVAEQGLSDVVRPEPYLPYLEFLNLTTRMDVLLINDYRTAGIHPINPYLPAKWSDYRGSGTDVWAIVEPGSVLSTQEVAYRSELDDVDGALQVLRTIIGDHALATTTR